MIRNTKEEGRSVLLFACGYANLGKIRAMIGSKFNFDESTKESNDKSIVLPRTLMRRV